MIAKEFANYKVNRYYNESVGNYNGRGEQAQ